MFDCFRKIIRNEGYVSLEPLTVCHQTKPSRIASIVSTAVSRLPS
jgi:hypothetical protein